MAIEARHLPDENLVVIRVRTEIRPEPAREAIEAAYASGCLAPGRDRLLLIAPTARLHRMDHSALARHRERVLACERAAGGPRFRLAVAAASPLHRPLAELYAALWDLDGHPGVGVGVHGCIAAALAWLDRAHLLSEFDGNCLWRPGHPLLNSLVTGR